MRSLHLDGAAHGINDAAKLYKNTIPCPLDDAAMMHGDGGIDQIAPQPVQSRQGWILVGTGKLAVSGHVRPRMAASFRVSAMAAPSLYARLSQLIVQAAGSAEWVSSPATLID